MDRFEYDQHNLHPNEDEVSKHKTVKIYDGNQKNATFENGDLVVTSHRILYATKGSNSGLCLRLHYVIFIEEEQSSSFGFSRSKKILLHLMECIPGKQPGPVNNSVHNFIKLSFKESYDSSFIGLLNRTIQQRKWEIVPIIPPIPQATGGRVIRAGIVGIERQIQQQHKATGDSISLAFEDLNKLMKMATEMVQLSKSISDKIKEHQGDISDDETVRFKSYLLSLGIEDPVTRDSFRSENQFYNNLAQQIATMLEEQIKDVGGMMTLTEAFCRVNRARGLELLSPDDMLRACENATFENGDLVVTSHRILYATKGSNSGLCLRLHYVIFIEEEQSSSFGFSRSKKILLHLMECIPGKQPGPVNNSVHNFIKLSFKESYDSSFIGLLNRTIQQRKWEIVPIIPPIPQATGGRVIRAGIVGIERQIQQQHKATGDSISLAFEDLNKLMKMATEMVQLSKSISDKIKEHQGDISDDETVRFKSYLLSLGIEDPVTRDSFRSENQFYNNLAQQIATMLEEQIKDVGGMMTLTEAFCRVNRARGLELLSPDDMLRACELMGRLRLPVVLRTFDSGVKVLQLTSQNDDSIAEVTAAALEDNGSYTAEELAAQLGISILLATERLITTEKLGKACRDESIEALRFYPNLFLQK
ncbi:hypothetical protein B566_EDAN004185 [Ephemera danica]|nr:hypothetical protein B566_EDAN004185 [Ephemera danica]